MTTAELDRAAWLVRLSCGHAQITDHPPARGGWISCWPGQLPFPGCQTQRRVVAVTELGAERLTSGRRLGA
jgi:hypothetical protein